MKTIYDICAKNDGDAVVAYIPQSAKANHNHFGVSNCSVDGQRHEFGDCVIDSGTQSCCKIINYCIAYIYI